MIDCPLPPVDPYLSRRFDCNRETHIEPRLFVKTIQVEKRICKAAQKILLENIEQRITIQELCKKVGSNPSTLSKLFNQTVHQSPFAWLKKERLNLAARLLRKTDCNIYHVANAVGYADANNFSTAFRQTFGISPKEFRKSKEVDRNAKLCII